jgi:hypothetical protein
VEFKKMKKNYSNSRVQFIAALCIIMLVASCKKDVVLPKVATANQVTLGLYEFSNGSGKRIFMPVTKVGNQSVTYYSAFDTGSAGMAIDADGILPASMISSSGISVQGDSINVNGITVTSKQSVISFGDQTNLTKEYGNLAYATITIGDQHGNINIQRVPIFLYYKIVDVNNNQLPAHSNDVFGVGPGVSYAFNAIASPLSYFTAGANTTSGFKLAVLNNSYFSSSGTYVAGLLTVGLTSTDLSAASGFIMHPLTYYTTGGYSPNIPSTITYNGKSIAADVLFDTGSPSVTIIEDKTATNSLGALPANSVVTVTTNKGFTYQYVTTSTANLTAIQNPNNSNDTRTIFSIDFFIKNEILTDYTNHQIGLKNN